MRAAVLVSGLSLLATALPAVAADRAVLESAANAVAICAQNMPDIRKTKSALNEAGFRLDESDGRLHIYTVAGARVVVGVTTPSAPRPACIALASKMTPAEARLLMQPWIDAAKAVPIRDERVKYSHTYVGTFNNGPVMLGVINNLELKIVRGAAVIATGLNKQ